MQRWHKTDCTSPDVVTLADKVPRCQACDSRPQIEALISSNASTSSVPIVPPDLPSGQMNLWWPPAVPYSTSTTKNSEASSQHLGAPTAAKEKIETSALPAAPYEITLKSDEFRLVFLDPVETHDSPVHLSLEIYNMDNCPEYEAVSYTWAGEDGDNTLSQPIYVGLFWDILLQTKNCWAMLQFMRPPRLPRMIWVDSICINQRNTLERSMQVANMGNIYSACSRVVVYLGPDIAMSLFDRHPRRRMLHEFETGEIKPCFLNDDGSQFSPSSLREILKLRYFSRIWVIQELLLSQRVVIRIGDVDYWADSATATHFSLKLPAWDWSTTAATWVQFISQGTSREMNLPDLLKVSSASRATDPRDRIFGLLGILPELKTQCPDQIPEIDDSLLDIKGEIQADYSLSCQQMFIGLFAYCLLNRNQPNILYRASCLSRSKPDYPTWAPNWVSADTWTTLFQKPKLTDHDLFREIIELPEYVFPYKKGVGPQQYRVAFNIYELKGPGSTYIGKERHWRKGAFIDASTASLNINLTQYMVFSRPLERVGTINKLHLFCMRYDCFSVYVVSEERLDRVLTGKGNEELFILNLDGCSFIYLLLRRQTNEHGAVTYKLISACPRVQLVVLNQQGFPCPNARDLRLDYLQCSVYDVIKKCREILNTKFMGKKLVRRDTGILVGITAIRDLVPVLKQLYQQRSQHHMSLDSPKDVGKAKNRGLEHSIGEAFIQCVDQKLSPRLDSEYVTISISTSTQRDICHVYLFRTSRRTKKHVSNYQHKIWKYRIKDSGSAWESPYISPSVYDNLLDSSVERRLEIQFPISWVIQFLTTNPVWRISEFFEEMDRLSGHFGTIGEDLWSLVVEGSKHDPDLRFVSLPNHKAFGEEHLHVPDLFVQLGMNMNTSMVCIE